MRFFELLSGCVEKSEFHFLGKMDKYTSITLEVEKLYTEIKFYSIQLKPFMAYRKY